MKGKSFHCSKSGAALPIAQEIGAAMQCVCDKMPPAYPCDRDRLVFIGVEMKGTKVPAPVVQFCKDLNSDRTKAVAFYVINGEDNTSALDGVVADLETRGVKTVGERHFIKVQSSFFKKGMPTMDDVTKAVAWAKKVAEIKF